MGRADEENVFALFQRATLWVQSLYLLEPGDRRSGWSPPT
jgi:hypothetical protein